MSRILLADLIGNEETRAQLMIAHGAAKLNNRAMGHVLFTGNAGCGKTSTSRALANLSGGPFVNINPESIKTPEELAEVFQKFPAIGYNEMGEKVDIVNPAILFIDEAHRLSLKTQEFLGIAMEEYYLTYKQGSGRKKRTVTAWVPEFTVVCATTKEGELSKPFRDRFKLTFVFTHYEMSEAEAILEMHAKKMAIRIEKDAAAAIARRGRGTPRILVRFLERMEEARHYMQREVITLDLVEAQFSLMGIDPIGLTKTDIKILTHLYDCEIPTGLDSLAVKTGIDSKTISEVNEPYLILLGFLERTRGGRIVTESGVNHLVSYKHVDAPEPEFNNSRVIRVKS